MKLPSLLILVALGLQAGGLGAQQDLWDREPIDVRAGLNNGIRKLFLHLEAKRGAVPLLRFRSRLIDAENIAKEVFGDLVPRGRYVYEGSAKVERRGNSYVEHRFAVAGGRRVLVALEIEGIEAATLRDLVHAGFDVAPDRLPFALVTVIENTRVLHYPLRDVSKWQGREEEALLRDEVPMEKTADRLEALRYSVHKLVAGTTREERLKGLRQIAFYDTEELDPAVGALLNLREDEDPEVAKAVRAFCIERNLYSQQELWKALYQFRLDDRKEWLASLDLLDKIPERDAARDAAPALKHFLRDRKPAPEIARRAEAKLASYRKLLPPGGEDVPLPRIGPETGWIPMLEPGPVSRPAPEAGPESRPATPPTSRPSGVIT